MCNTCGCGSTASHDAEHSHCGGCGSHDLGAETIFCASCTDKMEAETMEEFNVEYGTRNRYKLNGNQRYVARNSKGQFISNVDVGRSLAADKREPKPTRHAKAGKRGMGDHDGHHHAEQGYNDRDDESIGMRHRGAHKQSMKDRRDESKGMTDALNKHHPYSDVSTMSAEFEAMARLPPGEQDVASTKAGIKAKFPNVRFSGTPVYLTETQGTSSKFHVFIMTNLGGFNGTGRIGYKANIHGPMSESVFNRKMSQKLRKGYKKTQFAETFEAPKYGKRNRYKLNGNHRYVGRNAKGQFISNVDVGRSLRQDRRSNAKSQKPVGFRGMGDARVDSHHAESLTNAIVQWENDSGLSAASAPPNDIMFADQVELAKPVETGAKIGLGFMLLSAGAIVASAAIGMVFGDN